MAIQNLVRCVLPIVVIALVSQCVAGGESRVSVPADLSDQVDALFAKWNRLDAPGCAVGIVHRGQVVYSKGFGAANLDFQVPNTPQTVFEVASFAKSLECVCLAMLMDEGKISPEDDLRKFVPEMHSFDPPIHIQDMVRCRSGLWDQVSVPILIGWENAPLQHPHTEADFLSLISGQKTLPFKPGTQFAYSSGDYFLLGVIVKRITDQSLAQFAKRRVFEPLGMSRTFFEADETRVVDQRAVGHWKPKGDAWHQWRPTNGGGLKTCVEDLVRWDQNFSRNRLPNGKHLDEFLREGTLLGNRYCLDVDAYFKETDPEARRESPTGQYRGLKRRQFTGGSWGFTAAMSQFPDQDFTVICLGNSDDITAWTMNRRIADIALGDVLRPLPTRITSHPVSELPTAAVSEAELRDKVGAYRLKSLGLIWQITLQDGKLELTDHLLAKYPLRPLSATSVDPEGSRFYATTHFDFSPASADSPKSFTSQWDEPENRGSLKFEAIELVSPTPDELAKYAGEYVSDELAATYRFQVRDDQLWLRVNSRRWEQLDATIRDEFIPHLREPTDGRIMTFLRDARDDVIGLSTDYFRVKGVRFTKR